MHVFIVVVITTVIVSLVWAWWIEKLKYQKAAEEIKKLHQVISGQVLPAVLSSNYTMDTMTDFLEAFFLSGQWRLIRVDRNTDNNPEDE